MQFALGGRVFPPVASWIRLTERFRGAALDALARQITNEMRTRFRDLPPSQQGEFALMTGKGADGKPLAGHRHAFFLLLPDNADHPTRLVCFRREPFSAREQEALLAASELPLSWDYGSGNWLLRAVPLPTETVLPKTILGPAAEWESATPYVPSRHVFARNGKPKPGLGVCEQVVADLANAGLPESQVMLLDAGGQGRGSWVRVHRPRRNRETQTNDMKRGYKLRVVFPDPVGGPIAIGHSAHFGLGLFVPAVAAATRDCQ
jgi:CRISPR-associated protein Csb2